MDNQFSPSDLSVTNIAALSNAKEVVVTKKNKISILILIAMIVFTVFFVFLSVYNFGGATKLQKTQEVSSYNKQVQQMAK
jgi:hypothetical protein